MAVTVAGAAAVAVVDEMDTESEALAVLPPPEPPPLPVPPKGGAPALPLPPHAATSERVIAAKAHFKNFIKVSLDFWLGLAGVSGRPSGR